MAHRIKLTQPANSLSFSHSHSISQNIQPKHKKKGSLYLKGENIVHRLRTDEKDPSFLIPEQKSQGKMMRSQHSACKLSRAKKAPQSKKSKHTISVINLSQNIQKKGSSTVTKRKHSQVDFSQKIRQKIDDFKIIANCLEEYTREQRKNNAETNIQQIIKIISAFNRSEIAPISKPLEKLIHQIMLSIKDSLPHKTRKPSLCYSSPQKENEFRPQIKETVKKTQGSRQHLKEECPGEVTTLEQNLGKLKYQSNRLKYFLQEISSNGGQQQVQKGKIQELMQLKSIARQQEKIIHELSQSEDEGTFRRDV